MATVTQAERTTETGGWPSKESIEAYQRQARQAVENARQAARHVVADTELNVRRHPLEAVGLAAVAGAVFGGLVGFGAGWLTRARR